VDDNVIVRRAKKTKTKVCDRIFKEKRAKALADEEEKPDLESFLNQDDYVEFLRDSVRAAPVNPLHKRWRKKILGVNNNTAVITELISVCGYIFRMFVS